MLKLHGKDGPEIKLNRTKHVYNGFGLSIHLCSEGIKYANGKVTFI